MKNTKIFRAQNLSNVSDFERFRRNSVSKRVLEASYSHIFLARMAISCISLPCCQKGRKPKPGIGTWPRIQVQFKASFWAMSCLEKRNEIWINHLITMRVEQRESKNNGQLIRQSLKSEQIVLRQQWVLGNKLSNYPWKWRILIFCWCSFSPQ